MKKRGARRAHPVLAAIAAAATLVACSRARDAGPATDAGAAFDEPTMAFLSEARALHHEANVKEGGGDVAGAIDAVARITRAPRPHASSRVPEIEEVLSDAYARLAELETRAGDLDAAGRDAREGLAHAPDDSYFRGHLLEVEGIVEEARAAALADAGDAVASSAARGRAMAKLEEAVRVQERVIGAALGDGGGGGR